MKRVLVTGAAGFIGRHSLRPLLARGCEVHAVTPDVTIESPQVTWHHADLLDSSAAAALMAAVRPTHLLHFAWNVRHGEFWTSLDNLDWTAASLRLFRAFVEAGGQRAVVAGTCAEYDWNCSLLRENETPLHPSTLYGVCKHALRLALESLAAQRGLSAAWGRIFMLYGPHEHPDRLVSSVIRSLLSGRPAECSPGDQVRDFLYVEDVADAFAALLDSAVTGAVNIASGRPAAIRQIVLKIAELMGRPELVRLGARPAPPGDPARLEASVERLTREVGWAPRHSLEDGLLKSIAWWKQEMAREPQLAEPSESKHENHP
jgi:nucleoside-diphosphate-sugar epimerase